MRKEAIFEPVESKPDYDRLDTLEKVIKEKEDNIEEMMRFTRFMVLMGHVCSLVMTLDKYEGKSMFHLSMVEQKPDESSESGIKHLRIPDSVAGIIAPTLLGGDCQEMPHEGKVFVLVRDFVREAA